MAHIIGCPREITAPLNRDQSQPEGSNIKDHVMGDKGGKKSKEKAKKQKARKERQEVKRKKDKNHPNAVEG